MDIRALPLFVYLLLVIALGMYVPTLYAYSIGDIASAKAFSFFGFLILLLTAITAIAMVNRKPRSTAQLHLITLLFAYLLLPILCALPLLYLAPEISFRQAYFEMLSCLTTTGATVFLDPETVAASVHVWRSLVAWLGGLIILVAAFAVLEPLNLGGFEIRSDSSSRSSRNGASSSSIGASDRIIRAFTGITPIYSVLTFALSIFLIIAGQTPFDAILIAMAVLSTSGVSPHEGLVLGNAGVLGEVVIVMFFVFAITHRSFDTSRRADRGLVLHDPEFQIAAVIAIFVTLLLFMRHYFGAVETGSEDSLQAALRALWGTFFTTISFLSTTGFVSQYWDSAQNWSGLETNGLILLALALMGGGIATTAGGIKLLRAFALYKHGQREISRLVHPSSIAGSGMDARRIRREGAYIAWIFVMLLFLSVSIFAVALTLAGLNFESALVFSIAALSNTGPLPLYLGEEIETYASFSDTALAILDVAMIIGRLEVLAVVALLNPEYWRA